MSVLRAESVRPTNALKKFGYVNVVPITITAQRAIEVKQNPQTNISDVFLAFWSSVVVSRRLNPSVVAKYNELSYNTWCVERFPININPPPVVHS